MTLAGGAMRQFLDGREGLSPRGFALACGLVCLLALALRLPMLASRSLWLDETYSAWFAALPLRELWRSVPLYETHPPMYYTLLKGWTAWFGAGEAALRSLSVAASVLTVLLLALAGKVLRAGPLGDRVALLAALFLAVNQGHVLYAQQARPYALQTLTASAAILASLLLLRGLHAQAGGRIALRPLWPAMAALALAAGATLWLHNTGLFIAFGIWCALALAVLLCVPGHRPGQALAVALPGVAALLIWSPFLPMFVRQSAGVAGNAFWVVAKWHDVLTAWILAAGGALAVVPVGLLALAGARAWWRAERHAALHLLTVLVVPLSVVLAFSYLVKPIYINRLFEWMAPAVMALAALGVLAGCRDARLRRAAALTVLALGLVSTFRFYLTPGEDWRGLLAKVGAQLRPGDVMIVLPNEIHPVIAYYAARGPLPPVRFVPAPFPALGLPRRYVGNLGAPAVIPDDRRLVRAALATHGRVWLVSRKAEWYDPQGLIRAEVAAARRYAGAHGAGSVAIELYE